MFHVSRIERSPTIYSDWFPSALGNNVVYGKVKFFTKKMRLEYGHMMHDARSLMRLKIINCGYIFIS